MKNMFEQIENAMKHYISIRTSISRKMLALPKVKTIRLRGTMKAWKGSIP
jgi:hypothetical protein